MVKVNSIATLMILQGFLFLYAEPTTTLVTVSPSPTASISTSAGGVTTTAATGVSTTTSAGGGVTTTAVGGGITMTVGGGVTTTVVGGGGVTTTVVVGGVTTTAAGGGGGVTTTVAGGGITTTAAGGGGGVTTTVAGGGVATTAAGGGGGVTTTVAGGGVATTAAGGGGGVTTTVAGGGVTTAAGGGGGGVTTTVAEGGGASATTAAGGGGGASVTTAVGGGVTLTTAGGGGGGVSATSAKTTPPSSSVAVIKNPGPKVSLSLKVTTDCSGDNLKTLNISLQTDIKTAYVKAGFSVKSVITKSISCNSPLNMVLDLSFYSGIPTGKTIKGVFDEAVKNGSIRSLTTSNTEATFTFDGATTEYKPKAGQCQQICCDGAGGELTVVSECSPADKCEGYLPDEKKEDGHCAGDSIGTCSVCDEGIQSSPNFAVIILLAITTFVKTIFY